MCDIFCIDSAGKNWADSVVGGLPLNRSGPVQWTPYTRRRLIRWIKGKFTAKNYLIFPHNCSTDKRKTIYRVNNFFTVDV